MMARRKTIEKFSYPNLTTETSIILDCKSLISDNFLQQFEKNAHTFGKANNKIHDQQTYAFSFKDFVYENYTLPNKLVVPLDVSLHASFLHYYLEYKNFSKELSEYENLLSFVMNNARYMGNVLPMLPQPIHDIIIKAFSVPPEADDAFTRKFQTWYSPILEKLFLRLLINTLES
jgi:hypothetical protein